MQRTACCLMWYFLPVVLGACSPDVHATCKQGYQTVDVNDTAGYDDCILCHNTGCTPPTTNTVCFPASKSCAVCGSPTIPRFGPDYTLTLTSSCIPGCTGDVYFDSPLYFVNTNGLTIKGGANLGNVVAKQCPLFIFQGNTHVTLDGLNIICETNSMCSTPENCAAPAIFISETTRAVLNIGMTQAVRVYGNAKSVVLVQGGIFSAGLMNVDMTGSHIGDVYNEGVYRQEFDVVLGNYAGIIDAKSAEKHTRFVLQPALATAAFLSNSVQQLILLNYALYANTFGIVYEVMYNEANVYGFMDLSADYDTTLVSLFAIGNVVVAIALVFTVNDIYDLSEVLSKDEK